jgi:hypothetical protein
MKFFLTLFTLLTLTGLYGCNRGDDPTKQDETTIQREEEIRRDDVIERRSLPSETTTDDEIQIDRKVIDEDELELDQ